ncbi:MAG: hypothetical protein NVS3B28_04680 [Candidatus Velthaea sp.]
MIDAPQGSGPVTSAVRSIVRANHRIAPLDALRLSTLAYAAAKHEGVDGNFIAATLLQESAFDPRVISPAGAAGIAQFTISTARAHGIDPFDPEDAVAGGAHLLAEYLARYAHERGDPYALTLAAYNAGPEAVSYYHGVPPYAETRAYIGDIYERWARLIHER